MMRAIAVDDEPLALSIIENFCAKIPFVELVESASNGIEASARLKEGDIDLLFLDINMPHISGVELAKSFDNPPMIIFTTAYSNYALEGFEVSAVDYLVKPFAFDRFFKAVTKAYELYSLRRRSEMLLFGEQAAEKSGSGVAAESANRAEGGASGVGASATDALLGARAGAVAGIGTIEAAESAGTPAAGTTTAGVGTAGIVPAGAADFLMVKVDYSVVKVVINDILFVEGLKDYIKICTNNGNVVTKSTMKNIEERLCNNFMRIHKSVIINLLQVDAYENNHVVVKGHRLPIGSQYRDSFLAYLNQNRL